MDASQRRNEFFQYLWEAYKTKTPLVEKVEALLLSREQQIYHDHVSFHTFAFPFSGLDHFTKLFNSLGYERRGEYFFESQKVRACHFECVDDPKAPKVFLNELLIDQLSRKTEAILVPLEKVIPRELPLDCFYGQRFWDADFDDFSFLSQDSERAAWIYAHGFRPNHFALDVNNLDTFETLRELNEFLEDNGVFLNMNGGAIKGGPQDHLEQSITMADQAWVEFNQGPRLIPSCHYEFVRRYEDDSGNLFQGLVTGFKLSYKHGVEGALTLAADLGRKKNH